MSTFARMILLFMLAYSPLVFCSSFSEPYHFRSDPYEILSVDPQCSQKDIQRQYRKLCLKHHPDKKRSFSGPGTAAEANGDGSSDSEFEFKEVQHAYSLVGTKEARRQYDLSRKFNSRSPTDSDHSPFPRHETHSYHNRFGGRGANVFGGPSTIYFTFGDGLSFKVPGGRYDPFGTRRRYGNDRTGIGRMQRGFGEMIHQQRPHYIQHVSVPLDVLYAGSKDFELKLDTSMFARYKAAFNGGVMEPVLKQALLTVAMIWLRSQSVSWFLSLCLLFALVHLNVPPSPEKVAYATRVRKGWKDGTKIKYTSSDADVTFVLHESNHGTFTRVGHDLHAHANINNEQLVKGCTLRISPLCDSEKPIMLTLKPNEVKIGQVVTIKSRGWPKAGKEEKYGDLLVKICSRDRRKH